MDVSSGAAVAALLLNDHDCHDNDKHPKDKSGGGGDDANDENDCSITSSSTTTTLEKNMDVDDVDRKKVSTQTCFRVLDLCCAPGKGNLFVLCAICFNKL